MSEEHYDPYPALSPHEEEALLHEELIKRIEQFDPELAQDVAEELFAIKRERDLKPYRERVQRAEANLDDAIRMSMDDPTGQDGEDYCDACARDLIDARDELLRESDPDMYAELKHMGQLR